MRNKKSLFAATFVAISLVVFAQNNTSSPYSRFGYGVLEGRGFGRSTGIGGTGIALRSNRMINPLNPASYTGIDSLSMIFNAGMSGRFSYFQSPSSSKATNDINFSYIGMNVPVTHWAAIAGGVVPYSFVGYDINYNAEFEDLGSIPTRFTGGGGLSQIFLGGAFKLFDRINLGYNLFYTFGMTDHQMDISSVSEINFSGINTSEKYNFGGLSHEIGFQYVQPIQNETNITIGGIYGFGSKLGTTQSYKVTKLSPDVVIKNLTGVEVENSLPSSFGVGLAYDQKNKFLASADFQYQMWENAKYFGTTDSLKNRLRISGGVEYIPSYMNRSFFKRIHYRAGASYSTSYLSFGNEQLNNFGITFGFGLPMRYTKTIFNIGIELGKVSYPSGNLISENYGKVTLDFSLNEFWFFKRRFE